MCVKRAAREEVQTCAVERGSIFTLAVFLVVVSLLLAGLGIDGANLFRARNALQKAADVAALGAIGHTIHEGMAQVEADAAASGQTLDAYLEDKARELALANLEASGYPHRAGRNDVTFTTRLDRAPADPDVLSTFEVELSRPVDFLLMHAVPPELLGLGSAGRTRLVNAAAASRRAIANVSLLFDVSLSMACPAVGSCACLTPARSGACPSSGAKIDDQIDAVRAFLKEFDYNNDRIVLVPIGMSGRKDFGNRTIQAMTLEEAVNLYNGAGMSPPANLPPNLTDGDIDALIAFFRENPGPIASTNLCDSLMRSHHAMSTGIAPGQRATHVVFTDGNPQAGRFLFANPESGLRPWNPYGLGRFDYSMFTVAWVEGTTVRYGPSPLYQTDYLPIGYQLNNPPPLGDGVTSAGGAGCGPASAPAVSSSFDAAAAANQIFRTSGSECLQNPGFVTPGSTQVFAATKAFRDWRQLFFDCAVQYADYMRASGHVLHSISVGPSDPDIATPYQTIDDPHLVKPILLARLANDYITGVVQSARLSGGTPWAEFGYSGYQSYADLLATAGQTQGDYSHAPTTLELKAIFQLTAKKILLGLTS